MTEGVDVDLNLHLVRYLVAVVDEGHLGRAAARLYVSGPALSKQIRTLEHKLGAELLDRSTHPLVPTEAGRRFLAEARVALDAADRAVAAVEAHGRAAAGVVRLGFMTAATGTHTRRIIELVQRDVPAASVQLVQLPWPDQADAVRAGTVDASLVRPPVADTDGLRLDVVRLEPRVVALPRGHRLAARAVVELADLDGEPHANDDRTDEQWVRWWACDPRPSGVPVTYGPTVHTMDELLEVVAAGAAVAITGSSVVDSVRHPEVVFVPIADVEPCPISLCTRSADRSPLVEALRRAVHAVRTAIEAEALVDG
ncbi:LysR family transcriptional regulator [Pseudonocardia sp. McavD-2-B]|uniref:LysR substrate-binding domain-containing protein n=1 Tax=Pseudonocardia sp. McavD-2-B TaxID=2954499 RepID=UPI002097C2AC|nr:LysR family transcriptional regulator [Pseudonocardia sp. McavD-2-B]MCO7192513.1 LysR family transcriptional regulator [Pseudonocardia sp. McavD-2-B]